jgi:hypothetical protein
LLEEPHVQFCISCQRQIEGETAEGGSSI